MTKIGEGWQYTTYDLENGRVRKEFHSPFKAFRMILRDIYPFDRYKPTFVFAAIKRMREKAEKSKHIVQNTSLPKSNFGNPKFESNLNYRQDLVIPLREYIPEQSQKTQKEIIDAFVEFNKKLLEAKCVDKNFSIGKNFGINNDGEIVLIDIGELISAEEDITRQIQTQAWTRPYVLEALPEHLHNYFIVRMDSAFG